MSQPTDPTPVPPAEDAPALEARDDAPAVEAGQAVPAIAAQPAPPDVESPSEPDAEPDAEAQPEPAAEASEAPEAAATSDAAEASGSAGGEAGAAAAAPSPADVTTPAAVPAPVAVPTPAAPPAPAAPAAPAEPTVRLFIAVDLPEAARADLAAAVAETREVRALVGDAGPALRWIDASRWHLTLAFLGDVPESTVPDLLRRLERAAGRIAPFSLRFAGGGRFGDRVLWAGVRGGRRPRRPGRGDPSGGKPIDLDLRSLRGLAGAVGAAARKAGVALEDRPYRAHLTLARAGAGADLLPWAAGLATYEGPSFPVAAISLVRSTLGPRPAYDTVATFPLAARGGDAAAPTPAEAEPVVPEPAEADPVVSEPAEAEAVVSEPAEADPVVPEPAEAAPEEAATGDGPEHPGSASGEPGAAPGPGTDSDPA